MCWSNNIAIPIVLKKPLRVYKVGTSTVLGSFISLYQTFWYHKSQTLPTVNINPEFIRVRPLFSIDPLWEYDNFYIHEGYHSYLTEEMARRSRDKYDEIGIFEIPAGATIYINFRRREVVSTDIKYLGLLEVQQNLIVLQGGYLYSREYYRTD